MAILLLHECMRVPAAMCRYYRAYGDTQDSNGHGTHVVGTLVGLPYGHTLATENSGGYVGMAPDAKVAFIGGKVDG